MQEPSRGGKKPGGKIWILVLCILLCIAAGAAFWMFSGRSGSEKRGESGGKEIGAWGAEDDSEDEKENDKSDEEDAGDREDPEEADLSEDSDGLTADGADRTGQAGDAPAEQTGEAPAEQAAEVNGAAGLDGMPGNRAAAGLDGVSGSGMADGVSEEAAFGNSGTGNVSEAWAAAGGSQRADGAAEDTAEFILPGSDSRYLTEQDLIGLTAEQLRLARNEIYARHGRKFRDEALQSYFDSKAWYVGTIEPDQFKDQSMLNEYEKKNLTVIQEREAVLN